MPKLKGRKTSWLLALALSLSGEFYLMQAAVAAAGLESYGYDALGRLIRVTYPTGEKIEYTYDAAGNRKTSGKGATPTITLTASPATDSFSIAANTVTTRTYTIANSGANAATALTPSKRRQSNRTRCWCSCCPRACTTNPNPRASAVAANHKQTA